MTYYEGSFKKGDPPEMIRILPMTHYVVDLSKLSSEPVISEWNKPEEWISEGGLAVTFKVKTAHDAIVTRDTHLDGTTTTGTSDQYTISFKDHEIAKTVAGVLKDAIIRCGGK
jgi:hypothetical protein